MTNRTVRRAFATAAVASIGLLGVAAPANADTTEPCDTEALAAAIDTAKGEVRAAQRAYTQHTRIAVHALIADLKSDEVKEARKAGRKADRLTAKAERTKDKEAREAAKEARKQARLEAKEAREVLRAGVKELKALVKAERRVLKAEWDAAKDALAELKAQRDACELEEPVEPPVEEPTDGGDPLVP
jgi:hypothetical protein